MSFFGGVGGGVALFYCNPKLNDTGKKDYVRLLASALALSSYVIRLLVK